MAATPTSRPRSTADLSDFGSADRRIVYLVAVALVIGVGAGVIAVVLLDLIGLFTNLFYFGRVSTSLVAPSDATLGLYGIVVPVIGAIVVGLLARFGSERIRGHGIPEAIEAILVNKSRIDPKVTVLKPVATAVSIGSGGPFGAEGPIIMTGGAAGSVFAQFLHVTTTERKSLLVAGAAAGMAAVFNSPLAAVLLSVELLLFEWRPRSLLPVGAAVGAATVVRWGLLGTGALFPIPLTPIPTATLILGCVGLGAVAGVASMALTRGVYAAEDAFRRLPIHWMWWPAIGAVAVGVGGWFAPRALGVGYGSIDALLLAQLSLTVILVLVVVKAVIWTVSLGSGTSGGVLAPLLLVGGGIGGALALVVPGSPESLFVLVGMGAMIGGTMRSPFTGAVFGLELTRDINALFPLLVAALVADGITVLLMDRSILTEKVARRGVHVAREYTVDPLERVPVRVVMRTAVQMIPAELSVAEAISATALPDASEVGLSLIGEGGAAVGFAARGDLRRFLDLGGDPDAPVRSLAAPVGAVAHPDEPMRFAADRLAELDGRALPVVDPGDPTQVVGFVTREAPFDARVLASRIEMERERLLHGPRRVLSRWVRSHSPPPQ